MLFLGDKNMVDFKKYLEDDEKILYQGIPNLVIEIAKEARKKY